MSRLRGAVMGFDGDRPSKRSAGQRASGDSFSGRCGGMVIRTFSRLLDRMALVSGAIPRPRFPARRSTAACALAAVMLCDVQNVEAAGPPPGPYRLTQTDIALYLSVLRETVARVEHPSAEDIAAQRRAEAAEQRQRSAYDSFYQQHQGGRPPTAVEIAALKASDPQPLDVAAIAHAKTLRLAPDSIIVRDRKLDLLSYRKIKSEIEVWVVRAEADPDRDPDASGHHPEPRRRDREPSISPAAPVESPSQKRQAQVEDHNRALVQPYLALIRRELRVIHHGQPLDAD